jgi:peptidoglycan/xylan/chitin deacetylase (PgdA/CDA1 family)
MRFASLSLDLDNQWSYMKTHGDAGWQSYPSYLDAVVPRILEFLGARGLKITFFIVGQDAALDKNRATLASIAAAGHEIGNHSFRHEPWLHLYTVEELDTELRQAEDAIEAATGVRPRGFRGPGFSLSGATLETLYRRGYDYDATVFPNLLNPLARAYLFSTSKLTAEESRQRSALFGTWRDALRPVRPFRWNLPDGRLLEIPVTTLPGLKVPMHLSYLIYLARFSRLAARVYLRFALGLCGLTGTSPSILLHPLDFMGREDCPELAFFPGMNLARERKMAIVAELFDILASRREIVTMAEHARRAAASGDGLPTLAPAFSA